MAVDGPSPAAGVYGNDTNGGTNNGEKGRKGGLTPSQLETFHRDGYLILPRALSPATVRGLLAETHRLLEGFSLDDHPLTRFSTGGKGGADHVGDDYFLESGDKVRFFFEEDAFDEATGRLCKPKERAVNKIGHYLHVLSGPFARLIDQDAAGKDAADHANARDGGNGDVGDRGQGEKADEVEDGADDINARPAAVAASLGFRDPRCLQSMVICKQPEIGGAVPPHQDSTFLYTDPPSAVGFWYALEDATLDNGCLSFLPGSHRWAPVRSRLVRRVEGAKATGTVMVDNDGPTFPSAQAVGEHLRGRGTGRDGGTDDAGGGGGENNDASYVPGEVKAGDLVLIHGNLLHKSERNTSQKGRIIYTFHIIEGDGPAYDERNWLQPPEEGFTKLGR